MKLIPVILFCSISLTGQSQLTRHIIELTDKKSTSYSLNNPSAYLSAKAIARRTRYNISVDSTDLPVSRAYIDSIAKTPNVTILNTSRWLNQVLIQTTDAGALAKIQSFPFVKKSSPVASRPAFPLEPEDKLNEVITEISSGANYRQSINENYYNYGNAFGQIHIHEGEFLHDNGFRGEGMTVAILDAGFSSYLTSPAFDSVRLNNKVLGTWDFVKNEASVNEDHPHGMYCFSIMASNRPGVLVGTAPKANYYLFRTEEAATEYPVEEQNWAVAAEVADSLGVDLITSSLGYSTFDDPALNHTYADMNGKNTMITRAADMAVKKGMIVTNSAGNSGASSWKYLIAPADGDSVFAIGAVNVNGQVAGFSSYGPSADGRIKPDIASVGWNTVITNTAGNAVQGSGTSFSNPNIAGLITCLWQAFPEFSNMEILDAVKKHSSRYSNPDDRIGYGIPNMKAAYEYLFKERQIRQAAKVLGENYIKAYPIPFSNQFSVLYKSAEAGKLSMELIDASGRIISAQSKTVGTNEINFIEITQLDRLPAGQYFLRYRDGARKGTITLVK
jgi:subtilisin family serine protease